MAKMTIDFFKNDLYNINTEENTAGIITRYYEHWKLKKRLNGIIKLRAYCGPVFISAVRCKQVPGISVYNHFIETAECVVVPVRFLTHILNLSMIGIINWESTTCEAMTRAVRVQIPIGEDTQHFIRT